MLSNKAQSTGWLLVLTLLILALVGAGCQAIPQATVQPAQPEPAALNAVLTGTGERLMRFETISVEQGLSQSVVSDIAQDALGFIWFATQDGLNRFDGYDIKIYRPQAGISNSLSSSGILSLKADSDGLWIGFTSGGLDRLDLSTGEITHYVPGDQNNTMLPGAVNDLEIDSSGGLWIGTSSGLAHLDIASGKFARYNNQPENDNSLANNSILALSLAHDGGLWIATLRGLDHFDPIAGRFTHFQHNPDDSASLSSSNVNQLWLDSQGRLWVSFSDNVLDRYDPASEKFSHFPLKLAVPGQQVGPVSALLEDSFHTLWVGTLGAGLCRFDEAGQVFTCFRHDPANPTSISNDNIMRIFEDRNGILWIGTFGGGANQLSPSYARFLTIANDPSRPNESLGGSLVFAVYQDPRGDLWVGMDDAGLDRVDARTGQVTHYRHRPDDPDSLVNDKVRAIYPDPSGALWIGTSMGLDLFDPASGRFTHFTSTKKPEAGKIYGSNIFAITGDAQGGIWIGALGCLNRMDVSAGPEASRFEHFCYGDNDPSALGGQVIYSLYADRDGMLWVGMIGAGIDRIDIRTGKITHASEITDDAKVFHSTAVMAIYEDSRGALWLGTSIGLMMLDRETGALRNYTTADGLPNEVIYQILEDRQGRLWLSTNYGLSAFDPRIGIFQNYDAGDGLQSNEFNGGASFTGSDGLLYFGGIKGLTYFNPEQIHRNPHIPPVRLTSVTQNGEPLGLESGELVVHWPNNFFDFDFAALNYIHPEDNQYAYLLEGFEQEWNPIGSRRSGRYTNLPGGTYTLRLKGSNNDGIWNEAGDTLRVRVIPPIWETWWFRGSAAFLLIGFVGGGVGLRTRSIRAHNQELERQVRVRTAEIERLYSQTKELAVIEERNRLARDLHDSAKQKAFAALAQLGAANIQLRSEPARAVQSMREAETLVYEVIEELTFLIQEMYPAALKEKGLPNVLREYLYEWESRSEINVDFQMNSERPLPLKLEQSLYRIIQEGLANVARHSRASKVEVHLTYGAERIEVCIADNGQGFDPAGRPSGVGLRSMQERIAMVGGTLRIDSRPGCGTRLELSAPIQLVVRSDQRSEEAA